MQDLNMFQYKAIQSVEESIDYEANTAITT